METIENIPVWGDPMENAVNQMKTIAQTADRVALMADHHVGYSMPIGGVAAYRNHISPSGVGYDIACGNKAVLTDMTGRELRRNLKKIMDEIWAKISFGIGRVNESETVDHALFDDALWQGEHLKGRIDNARKQLGTVGSGNHYVDLFVDEEDRVWIGVHFGSRGLGHHIATTFKTLGGASDAMFSPALLLEVGTDLGDSYLAHMELAGQYAYAGRDWVCQKVARILGAKILEEVHNHHNFAWRETFDGEDYWVVRKGATPAYPGQKGFVGGSMGDISVILEGVDHPYAELALRSTVHGAGRVLSRTQAAGRRKGRHKREGGQVTEHMMTRWLQDKNVMLRGGGTDESPHCYKRLPEVLDHHRKTIRILHTLTPVGVLMAGPDIHDPFRD